MAINCINCLANYTEAGSVIVNEEEAEFSYLKGKPELRRMSKFSMCVNCSRTINSQVESPVQDFSKNMSIKYMDGGKIYFLQTAETDIGEASSEEDGDSSPANSAHVTVDGQENQEETEAVVNTKTSVMFPTNTGCLIQENNHMNFNVGSLVQVVVNKCEEVSLNDVGILYFNQITKYRNVVNYNKRFVGEIENAESKILSNLKDLADDSQIRSSDKWCEHQSGNNVKRFVHYGRSAFLLEIKIPLDNVETLATNLLIDGFCLTVSFEGDDCNEEETRYLVHLSHSAASLCPDECEKIKLNDYLQRQNTEFSKDRFISSYLTSVFQKMKSLVKNIIKCPSSVMCSEEYFFTIRFDTQGVAYIEGYIWPDASLEYNEAESLNSFFGGSQDDARKAYLDFVDKTVTCTSSKEDLSRLGLNKNEASKVIGLVKKYQIPNFGNRSKPELPSLTIMFTHSPEVESMRNILEAEKLRGEMKAALSDLTEGEIQDLSTEEWLQDVSSWRVEIEDNGNNERLEFQLNDRKFSFILDELLLEMIVKFEDSFIGVYHYSIACVEDEAKTNSIILKRGHLIDCVTNIYNPFILQAMMAPTAVTPVYGLSTYRRLAKCEELLSEDGISPTVVATHQQISLTEAYSLSDPKKFRDIASLPVIYCNTDPDARTVFTKVSAPSDQSFTANGQNGHYELCYNVVTRHKCRINGENLLLCETAAHYEYVGDEESKKLFPVYSTNLEKIAFSDTENISKSHKLPDLILCSNKQVLKKRKTMKVINYPEYEFGSKKFKFSRILLFYPLAPGAEVSDNDVNRLFYETNDDQPLDKHNRRLTIIDNNERLFYKRILNNS